MEFEDILTGERCRTGEVNRQAAIEDLPVGISERQERSLARLGNSPQQGFGDGGGTPAGDADDADTAATRRGRDGGYGVV
jgi:hypothetical protein